MKATQESEQILHRFPQKETTTTKKSTKFYILYFVLHRSPQKKTTTTKKSAKFLQGCNDLEGFEKVSLLKETSR